MTAFDLCCEPVLPAVGVVLRSVPVVESTHGNAEYRQLLLRERHQELPHNPVYRLSKAALPDRSRRNFSENRFGYRRSIRLRPQCVVRSASQRNHRISCPENTKQCHCQSVRTGNKIMPYQCIFCAKCSCYDFIQNLCPDRHSHNQLCHRNKVH